MPSFDPDTTDPDTGAPLPVDRVLNSQPPPLWTLDYLRSDLWGLTVPGLPAIPGGASGPAQSRMLTYLLHQYPRDWQDAGLKAYGERGYSHWWLSWPDARAAGCSITDYVDQAQRVKRAGLWPCHFLRSKDYDGRNPDPALIDPVVSALLAAGCLSWASHAWEASIFYDPDAFRVTIDRDATRSPSVRWMIHLQQGYADYGPDGPDHARVFWRANLAVGVKRLGYQYKTDPAWSGGMMQARTNDCLVRLVEGGTWGLPETVQFIPFEVVAQLQFNNQRDGDGMIADEDTGNLKGYECLCSPGPSLFGGYGNGARRPDGTAL